MAWARESGSGGRGSGGGSGSGPGIGGVGCGVGSGGGNGLGSGGMPAVCPCGDSRKRPLMRRSARCRLKVGAAGGQPWSTERIVASSCGASCSSFQSRSTARRTSSATRPKTRLLDEHGPVVVSRRAHASNLDPAAVSTRRAAEDSMGGAGRQEVAPGCCPLLPSPEGGAFRGATRISHPSFGGCTFRAQFHPRRWLSFQPSWATRRSRSSPSSAGALSNALSTAVRSSLVSPTTFARKSRALSSFDPSGLSTRDASPRTSRSSTNTPPNNIAPPPRLDCASLASARDTCLAATGGSRTPSTPSVCRQSAWSRPHDGAPRGRFVDARSRHEVNAPARTSQNRSPRLSCRGHVNGQSDRVPPPGRGRAPHGGALRLSCPSKEIGSSPGWTRTNNPPVNSRMLCQLSYRGRQRGQV